MLFLRRSLTGLFLLAVTLALLALAVETLRSAVEARRAGADRGPPARERVFAVNVVTPEAGTVTPLLTAFGELRSRRTLELRAPAGGVVTELAAGFEDGAEVTEGQLLLRIDPADAEAARALAEADLRRAEAEERDALRMLALARDELAAAEAQAALRAQALERQRSLAARGVGSEAAVETAELAAAAAEQAVLARRQAVAQAETRRDQAATALARQRIALAEAERRLADTALHAPFSGTLADVSVVAGGIVAPNERLGRIIDPEALEVAFRLSTAQYARLLDAEGALLPLRVEVVLEATGFGITATGRIARVSGAVGEGQAGRLVYARLEGAPRGLRPGDFVEVRVEEPPLEGVAVLPAAAVGPAGSVLVLGAEDRLEEVAVEILRRQGEQVIVPAAGIAGRQVVAERAPMLGAGIRVRPIPAPSAGAAGGGAAAAPPGEEEAPALVELSPERRARLIAYVEGNARLPQAVRARLLAQLAEERVPREVVARIEAQMGS